MFKQNPENTTRPTTNFKDNFFLLKTHHLFMVYNMVISFSRPVIYKFQNTSQID